MMMREEPRPPWWFGPALLGGITLVALVLARIAYHAG